MIRRRTSERFAWLIVLALVATACGASAGDSVSEVVDGADVEPTAVTETEEAEPEPTEPEPEPEPESEPEEAEPDPEPEPEPEPETEEAEAEPEPDVDETPAVLGEGAVANPGDWANLSPSACRIDTSALSVDPECFEMTVPVDWDNPDNGETVTLVGARFSGGGSGEPIIYFDGGPGVATIELAPLQYPTLIEPFVADHDFIIFDQRGVGFSQPSLACEESNELFLETLASDLSTEEMTTLGLEAQGACRDRLLDAGVNLEEYHSINSANDVEALRQSLDLGPLNIIGISYGSRLANSFMRMFPGSVRAVVLDGNVPTSADLWTNFGAGAERAFGELFGGCAASASCSSTFPDFEDRYFELLDQLDAEPVTLNVANVFTGTTHEALLRGDTVVGLTFGALYGKSLFSLIPEGVELAFEGDYSAWELLASVQLSQAPLLAQGQQLSVECHEEIAFESVDEHDENVAANPRIAALDEPNLFDSCEQWPSGAAPQVESEAVVSDLPALVLSGQYDPITPPEYGDVVAETLSNSFVFTLPHEGHGVSTTDCGATMVLAFFETPDAEPDSACIADIEPPAWIPTVDDGSGVTFVDFDMQDGRPAIRPEGWNEAGPGVFVRGNDALDPTVILIQPHGGQTVDQLAAVVNVQFGAELEADEPIEIGDTTWSTLAGTSQAGEIRTAISGGPSGVLVLISGEAAEIDGLIENVGLPIITDLSG